MTREQAQSLDNFDEKMRRLMAMYESKEKETQTLRADLDRKQNELMLSHKNLVDLQNKFEHLRMARIFSPTKEEAQKSKNKLSKLVREIDKCIALLNQ